MESHRGEIGGVLLGSAVACLIAAVPVATAKGSSWTNSAVVGLLAGGLLCLVAALWLFGVWKSIIVSITAKRRRADLTQAHTGLILADASRDALRDRSGVRPMLGEEDELPLSELPDGIYGFATPWSIEPWLSGASGAYYCDLTLSADAGGTAAAELHKRADGELALVGYMTPDELVALRNPSRQERLDVVLRLAPDATRTAVSIPLGLLASARDRHPGGSYVLDLGLRPWD